MDELHVLSRCLSWGCSATTLYSTLFSCFSWDVTYTVQLYTPDIALCLAQSFVLGCNNRTLYLVQLDVMTEFHTLCSWM